MNYACKNLRRYLSLILKTDKSMKMNDLTYKVFTGEVDFDKALKIANKASNSKQNLNKRFIQKTSKKS